MGPCRNANGMCTMHCSNESNVKLAFNKRSINRFQCKLKVNVATKVKHG